MPTSDRVDPIDDKTYWNFFLLFSSLRDMNAWVLNSTWIELKSTAITKSYADCRGNEQKNRNKCKNSYSKFIKLDEGFKYSYALAYEFISK